jgi:putative FmdB family regulatory protein
MPLYEYRCQTCGVEFEQLVFDREAKVVCKECGAKNVVRLLSTFAVVSAGPRRASPSESGLCGACGAPQRGMCEMN